MKIKEHIYAATAAVIMLQVASCTKYLDIKPYDRVIPETAEEFSALLHHHLNNIDEGNENYLVHTFSTNTNFDAGYADDFEVCLTGAGGRLLPNYIGSYISYGNYDSYYSRLYECIKDCNIAIHEMKEEDTQASDDVRAAAYAMRGVAYYQLMRFFCEVPHPDNIDSQPGVPIVTVFDMEAMPARSSLSRTISQIESDLLTSISYDMSDPIYRFTPDVCKGYLARLYFWSKRWDDCLKISRELLSSHPLLGREEYQTMMSNVSKLSGNQLIKAYTATSVSGSSSVTTALSNLSFRPVSIRFLSNFYADETETDIRYGMWVNTKRQATKPVFCGMRGAEFKLMEAECLYHLNRTTEALESINDLRRNRIVGYQDIDINSIPHPNPREIMKTDAEGNEITPLLGLILRERRKELFLEGDRFFELKRNGSPQFSSFYNGIKYTTLSYMYTMPIPIRDIDITGNLIQNPGYTEIINKN